MQLTWRRLGMLAILGAAYLATIGCMEPQTPSAPQPRPVFSGGYRTQTLDTNDVAAAFAAAQGVVVDCFKIVSADPRTGVITFEPVEYTRVGGARMRRTGQIAIQKVGATVVASIRIQTERYVTPNLRAMSNQFRPDDRPGVTPIQEEAGLTPAQQEYWNPEGRDSRMEAQILQRLAEVINQMPSNSSQPATSASEAPAQ